jgi:hypothetical protein
MSHPFGDLVSQHLARKHGLSQNKLADCMGQRATVISEMCHGKRLTGPQSRERVLECIRCLHGAQALDTLQEADALLEAAGMSGLNLEEPREEALSRALADSPQHQTAPTSSSMRSPSRRNWRVVGPALIALAVMAILLIAQMLRGAPPPPASFWAAELDPIRPEQWMPSQATGLLEDLPGPQALIRENDPHQDFGKVETLPLTVDIDAYPMLTIGLAAIDANASCTVQILDQRTEAWNDIVEGIVFPGEYSVNLAEAMGWQGEQTFTINIWVGGESKAITLAALSITESTK